MVQPTDRSASTGGRAREAIADISEALREAPEEGAQEDDAHEDHAEDETRMR